MIHHGRSTVAHATEITHRCCAFFPHYHIVFAILVTAAFSVFSLVYFSDYTRRTFDHFELFSALFFKLPCEESETI